jgi:hypothetical protein
MNKAKLLVLVKVFHFNDNNNIYVSMINKEDKKTLTKKNLQE